MLTPIYTLILLVSFLTFC